MSAGASMRGGLLHIKGDSGPRCGVAMKGGDIVVEGRIGYLSFHGYMQVSGLPMSTPRALPPDTPASLMNSCQPTHHPGLCRPSTNPDGRRRTDPSPMAEPCGEGSHRSAA